MRRRQSFTTRSIFSVLCGILLAAAATTPAMGQASPVAVAKFNRYTAGVEARLAQQHRSSASFLAAADVARLQKGDLVIDRLTPSGGGTLSGAMLHHWRGTAFVPGARAADFEKLLKDFNNYPQEFSPQVLDINVLTKDDDHFQVRMRVRERRVVTVVLDTTYDVSFGQLDPKHRTSTSRSTEISELDSNGHPVSASREQGFLWRMNTYWSYEEKNGGLYVQIETVSLTRSIPTGLGWLVGPYVESVPRESMEFTLRSVCHALHTRLHQLPVNAGEKQLSERAQR